MEKDLEKMLDILDNVSPEIGRDTREYLNGSVFSGFNCFVMKKALFYALCEIEFSVLAQLEQCVDISNYGTQLSRIYGFMGEIISSGYIYHLEKRGFRVKHIPLVYFYNTDLEEQSINMNAILVLFYQRNAKPELFTVTWEPFLETKNPAHEYEAIICHSDLHVAEQRMLCSMAKKAGNVTVRFLDEGSLKKSLFEQHGNLLTGLSKIYVRESSFPLLPFLPYILEQYREIILISGCPLIADCLDDLWKTELKDGNIAAAPLDVAMLAQLNNVFSKKNTTIFQSRCRIPINIILLLQ